MQIVVIFLPLQPKYNQNESSHSCFDFSCCLVAHRGTAMYYAHRNLMQATKQTLDQCFEKAFIEVVDNQLNRLPLPPGTVTHFIYAPYSMKFDQDDFYFYGYQQTSAILQKMYRWIH